jgi:hypothetical protein
MEMTLDNRLAGTTGQLRAGSASTRLLVFCAGACVAAAIGTAGAAPPTLEYVLGRDATTLNGVPSCPGELFASNQLDNPSIDNNGNVLFRTLLDTTGAFGNSATVATRAIFLYGGPASSANPIHLIARDGTTASQLPNPNNWNTNSTTNGVGLTSNPTVTPGGVLFLSAQMNGTGATTTNNTGFWTGLDGSVAMVAQRGFVPGPNGVVPGTSGATWATNLNIGPSGASGNRCNDAGQALFAATFTGGDVSGTTNNDGMFVGSPAGIAMVARKGTASLVGLADPYMTAGATPTFGMFMNHQGEVAYIGPLTIGSGNLIPVSTNDDSCIFTNLGNPGGMVRVIARENDNVPWDPAGTTGLTCKVNSNPFAQLGQAMSRNRSYFTVITLGGTATVGVDDAVLAKYHWDDVTSTGTWTPLIRKGDVCPLVPHSKWGFFNNNNTHCTSNDGVTIAGAVVDDGSGLSGIGPSNNELIAYLSPSGQLRLVAREGSLLSSFGSAANLPGLPADAQFSPLSNDMASGGSPHGNALGQVIMTETIGGTGIVGSSTGTPYGNNRCLFAWDPNEGLILIGQTGTSDGTATGTILTPLIFNTVPGAPIGMDIQSLATGEGTGDSLTDTGWFVFRGRDNFGNYSAYRGQLSRCGSADFNHDGDVGTDADIEAFFACLGGNCCAACDSADFNHDGDVGTDADIEAFFRVLGGGAC